MTLTVRVGLAALAAAVLVVASRAAPAAEAGPTAEWSAFWSRDAGAGRAAADETVRHDGRPTVRVEHTGQQDWSLARPARVRVEPGDLWELGAWLRVEGEGSAAPCVIAYGADGNVREWALGERTVRAGEGRRVRARFVIPDGVAEVLPRVIGHGPATVWIGGFSLVKEGNVKALRGKDVPEEVRVENAALAVAFRTADATLAVQDLRTRQTWVQRPRRADVIVKSARAVDGRIEADLFHNATGEDLKAVVALDADRSELVVTLSGDGPLTGLLAFPHPFTTGPGTYLVVPMNEGISYPVDDASIGPMHLVAYGGHGIAMAFWGVTDGRAGQMAILETPDDARILIDRVDGRLCVAPAWEGQKGRLGYARRVRYVFLDAGGHVAMCKRYRAYAKEVGLLKTLEAKRREVPAVDLLVGAVNVWCWDRDAPPIVREMQAAGIERILWSNRQSPENLKALNEMPGVLTSRYDIYQDVMDPANFPLLRGVHADWTTEAWPKDLLIGAGGDWVRGWQVRAKDGSMIPCGVLCDRQAPPYADRRIGGELKTHPYRSRFIDTTTASPWRECHHPDHPMTRSESRRFKMDLLALVSGRFRLVTGCETGHDASVPYLHYFEGMLSLGPYRVPDAGRDMQRLWDEVPEPVAKFQLGETYRLPLWELVYHDCVVAQWYWGDYNNKLPALWDKRDLFNALYGTPPMFMFNRQLWSERRDRFVASYRATCPIARATGYAEMTAHRFLAPDRSVQQTVFANGVTVTVNFGAKPHRLADGTEVPPMACRAAGMP